MWPPAGGCHRSSWRERRGSLLRRLGLGSPSAYRLASQLFRCMKQKLALCCALIDRPSCCCRWNHHWVDPFVAPADFWDVLTTWRRRGHDRGWPPLIW